MIAITKKTDSGEIEEVDAKFRQKVTPGDVMKLEFEITKFRGKVGTADAAAYVDGKKVTTCQFTFIVDEAAEQTN